MIIITKKHKLFKKLKILIYAKLIYFFNIINLVNMSEEQEIRHITGLYNEPVELIFKSTKEIPSIYTISSDYDDKHVFKKSFRVKRSNGEISDGNALVGCRFVNGKLKLHVGYIAVIYREVTIEDFLSVNKEIYIKTYNRLFDLIELKSFMVKEFV